MVDKIVMSSAERTIDRGYLKRGAAALDIALTDEQIGQFERFAELLADWNTRLNLTSIPPERYVSFHFLDSLTLYAGVNHCGFAENMSAIRLIDVGTGAGFPGIPLKIAFPELQCTLIDGTAKRLRFVEEVIAQLGLTRIESRQVRAELCAADPTFAGKFDLAVARAVAPLADLLPWLAPFVRPGGFAVAMKSRAIDDELAEAAPTIARARFSPVTVLPVVVPETDLQRALVITARQPG